jgi:hypothetical protein
MSALNLKSMKMANILVNEDTFDVDDVDPVSVFVGEEEYCRPQSMSEFERECIIGEHMHHNK